MVRTVEGVAEGHSVSDHKDYSGGIAQRAMGRTRAAHPKLNIASWTLRQLIRPGEQWWADIGHMHAPDFRGDMYCRTFSEEHTGVVLQRFCADKTTATLIKQLEWLEQWVQVNVKGGALRVLRCDFGSEYAVQGRGDDILTAALVAFCAERPDFRVIPCPPHAHAFVKVEGAVHSTAGHAFSNACRANLGDLAWSITERGAMYQHNVRPVWRPADAPPGPPMSRIEALTGRRPDVSAMLGYVGQHGWVRNFDGKANSYRDNASPCIYVSPSLIGDGQLVYNIMSHTIQYVWSISLTDDPTACAALLAQSNLHRPRGAYGTPDPDDYSRRLRGLLVPTMLAPCDGHTMVQHDPISGMPIRTYTLWPVIGHEGDLVMSEWPVREFDAAAEDDLPALADASDSESDEEDVPIAVPAFGPGVSALEPDDAVAWGPGAPCFPSVASIPDSMRIWFRQISKKGASGVRFAAYTAATTVGEYRGLNAGSFMTPDLSWDLKKGLAWLRPGAGAPAVFAEAPWDRWGIATSACATMGTFASTDHENGFGGGSSSARAAVRENGSTREMRQMETARELAELHRIEALDDQPTDMPVTRPPRIFEHAPHFIAATAAARAGVIDDEVQRRIRAYAWSPEDTTVAPFDDSFVISPVNIGTFVDSAAGTYADAVEHVITGGVFATRAQAPPLGTDPRLVPPLTVRAAMLRPDFETPHGWRDAMTKEVRRVERFKAWELVRFRQFREMRERYPGRVSLGSRARRPLKA